MRFSSSRRSASLWCRWLSWSAWRRWARLSATVASAVRSVRNRFDACAWASAVGSVCSSIIKASLPAEVRADCQAVGGGDHQAPTSALGHLPGETFSLPEERPMTADDAQTKRKARRRADGRRRSPTGSPAEVTGGLCRRPVRRGRRRLPGGLGHRPPHHGPPSQRGTARPDFSALGVDSLAGAVL